MIRTYRRGLVPFTVAALCAAVALSCGSDGDSDGSGSSELGGTGGAGGTTTGTSGTDGTAGDGTGTAGNSGGGTVGTLAGEEAQTAASLCGDQGCACSNGIDDDGDGKTDGLDEECTGPFDDDEGSFATGIPGDNQDPNWQDCFFDGDSGAGNDGCRYHTECLTGERDSSDPDCQVSNECQSFCGDRTPNGCDCFGCCTISTDSGDVSVVIGTECSLEEIDDETKCPRCVPTDVCGNTCGECELCPGRTEEDLPESCTPDVPDAAEPPPAHTCDNGEQVCSEEIPCPSSFYCQLGCCVPVIR